MEQKYLNLQKYNELFLHVVLKNLFINKHPGKIAKIIKFFNTIINKKIPTSQKLSMQKKNINSNLRGWVFKRRQLREMLHIKFQHISLPY